MTNKYMISIHGLTMCIKMIRILIIDKTKVLIGTFTILLKIDKLSSFINLLKTINLNVKMATKIQHL